MSKIAESLGVKSDAGKDIVISQNEEKDKPSPMQQVKKYALIGGGVLLAGGIVYVGVRSFHYQTMRKKVEEASKSSYTAEYAIAMATAFKQFGGVTEYLYDVANEYLPNFLTPKDSDFATVKKIANELNGLMLEYPQQADDVLALFNDYFKKYTRKDFDTVARKVLDEAQYQEVWGIINNRDKSAVAENSYADIQDNSFFWNEQNVVKYGKSVGDVWTQNDLKNRIIMTVSDLDYTSWFYRDGAIFFNMDGKTLNMNTQRIPVPGVYRIDNSEYAKCIGGAALGILTGRVSRPDIAWTYDDYLQDLYLVEFVSAWNGLKYWVNVRNVAFVKGKENAKKNIKVTAKGQQNINMSLYMLDKCTMLDGSPLKGFEEQVTDSASSPTRTRAQISGINGAFPVLIADKIARYHAFIEGEIMGEMGENILFSYDKGNVAIPKNLVSVKLLS